MKDFQQRKWAPLSEKSGHYRTEELPVKMGNIYVVPKHDLYKTLSEAHSAIAHRGRDKNEHYIRESYAEISQEVITDYLSLYVNCIKLEEQRSDTDHVKKPVIKPLAADGFLKHVEYLKVKHPQKI